MTAVAQAFAFWSELAGPLAFSAALLIVPGLVVALAGGLRGFLALGFAPVMSVFCVAVGAITASAAGVAWTLAAPLATAAAMAVIVAVVRRWAHRPLARVTWPDTSVPSPPTTRENLLALAGLGLGVVLLLRHARGILVRADAFSQTFDNIFHLSLIRYIVVQGDASSLTVTTMTNGPDSTTLYPAAFHALASLTLQVFPAGMAVATNAVMIAIMAIVWPLSCLTLLLFITRGTAAILLAAGVLSASFSAFPTLLTSFGVLYPNLLGLALLPPVVGLAAQALAVTPAQRVAPLAAMGWGALSLVALALSHPNVVVSLLAIGLAPVIVRLGREFRRVVDDEDHPAAWGRLLIPVMVLAGIIVAWAVMRPPAAEWEPPLTGLEAVAEVLVNGHLGDKPAWVVSALMLVGLVVACRRRLAWVIGSWLVVAFLWCVVASWPVGEFRDALTAPWYNDSFRLAALVPTLATPLAALGFGAAATWCLDRMPTQRAAAGAFAALLTLLVVATQLTPAMRQAVSYASYNYALTVKSPLVSLDEYALIMRLPEVVGDATVVVNPWNGSSMAFALAGVATTGTHAFTWNTPDQSLVNNKLDELATDKTVCPAVERLGVG